MKSLLGLICFFSFATISGMSPSKTYPYTPDSLGLSYQDLRIKTSDSLEIHAWLMLPAPVYDKRTTIIISGSDAGNMSGQIILAYKLVMQGYTVMTYDYRGFGSSDSSFKYNLNLLYCNEFAKDLEAVMQFARKKLPLNSMGLMSFSMGTAISVMAMQKEKVDFVIFDGLMYNPLTNAARISAHLSKTMYLPDSAENIAACYSKVSCPFLVFAGAKDQITTLSDAKIVCGMTNNRSLIEYEGGHIEAFEVLSKKELGDVFLKKVFKFLKKQGY